MLTDQDKAFIDFWDKNRVAKKRWVRQLSVGLPLGVSLVLATVASLFFRMVWSCANGTFSRTVIFNSCACFCCYRNSFVHCNIFRTSSMGYE